MILAALSIEEFPLIAGCAIGEIAGAILLVGIVSQSLLPRSLGKNLLHPADKEEFLFDFSKSFGFEFLTSFLYPGRYPSLNHPCDGKPPFSVVKSACCPVDLLGHYPHIAFCNLETIAPMARPLGNHPLS